MTVLQLGLPTAAFIKAGIVIDLKQAASIWPDGLRQGRNSELLGFDRGGAERVPVLAFLAQRRPGGDFARHGARNRFLDIWLWTDAEIVEVRKEKGAGGNL